MHVRLTRIVQCRQAVSFGSDAQIGLCLFWGQPLLLQDGYLWSQLQRPRRLTLPCPISDWVKSPTSSRQRWSLVGVGTSFGASTTHSRPYRLTLTSAMQEAQGRHWREARLVRQQDSACRPSPLQCPDRTSLCLERHRATVLQDTGRGHPQFLLPHVWDISMFSRC